MSETTISILGVTMDLGQQRRGVDMGASAIRYAGLGARLSAMGYRVVDQGDISAPIYESLTLTRSDDNMHNADIIGAVCRQVYTQMSRLMTQGDFVITLGGDHSISLGTTAAALAQRDGVGVLWIDAHGDFNTPQTSPSGNVHGMVVSALMGRCPPILTIGERLLAPERVVYVGLRDLDADERVALRSSGAHLFTMRDIDERGIASIMRSALDALDDLDALHVSFDMDSLDPSVAPGVGTPITGGLSYREAHLLMEMLADDGRVRSLDLVEVNPILDDRNRTGQIAVEMASSLFGLSIL